MVDVNDNYVLQQFATRLEDASRTRLALALRLAQPNPESQTRQPRAKAQLARRNMALLPTKVLAAATAHKRGMSAKLKLAAKVYKGPEYARLNSLLRGGSEQIFLKTSVGLRTLFGTNAQHAKAERQVLKEYNRQIRQLLARLKRNVASIKTLYSLLKRPSLKANVLLFRGENFQAVSYDEEAPALAAAYDRGKGSVYEHRGFVSFSASPFVALNFMGVADCCLYRLQAGPHTPGLMYSNDPEFEFVMPPSTFVVRNVWQMPVPGAAGVTRRVLDLEFVKVLPLRLNGVPGQ